MGPLFPFRRRGRRALLPGEIRIMIWAGLLLGLLAFQALRWWPAPPPFELAPPPTIADPADPWTESGRSTADRGTVDPSTVRVIDGDTFDVAGTRIRIADIDTPEVFSPRCRGEAALGARATRRLRALLDQGPFELVPIGRDEDRYGRKLRIALRDGRSIGDRLVAEGLARTYDGGPRPGWCG